MKGTTTQSRTVLLPAALAGLLQHSRGLHAVFPHEFPRSLGPHRCSPLVAMPVSSQLHADAPLGLQWEEQGSERGSEGPGPQLTALSRVLRQISNKIPQEQHFEPHRSELCKTMTTTTMMMTAMSSSGGGAGGGQEPRGHSRQERSSSHPCTGSGSQTRLLHTRFLP